MIGVLEEEIESKPGKKYIKKPQEKFVKIRVPKAMLKEPLCSLENHL